MSTIVRIIVKVTLSIVTFIIFIFLNALQNHIRGSHNGTFGLIGMLFFIGFIGALIGIWSYKKKPSASIEKVNEDDIRNINQF
jgi:hypothetical protein